MNSKEFHDPYTCTCGGRHKMAGYQYGHYYYECNQCGKKVTISWITEEKK